MKEERIASQFHQRLRYSFFHQMFCFFEEGLAAVCDCVSGVLELQEEIRFSNEHRIVLLLVRGGGVQHQPKLPTFWLVCPTRENVWATPSGVWLTRPNVCATLSKLGQIVTTAEHLAYISRPTVTQMCRILSGRLRTGMDAVSHNSGCSRRFVTFTIIVLRHISATLGHTFGGVAHTTSYLIDTLPLVT